MVEMKVNQLLAEMQAMAKQAQAQNADAQNIKPDSIEFSNLLQNSIDKVSETQKAAGDLATRFELGDKSVELTEVMVNLQKASVSFQAMTQVRNRLVTAYQEIMNMQI